MHVYIPSLVHGKVVDAGDNYVEYDIGVRNGGGGLIGEAFAREVEKVVGGSR
jgi:hypothetical protein